MNRGGPHEPAGMWHHYEIEKDEEGKWLITRWYEDGVWEQVAWTPSLPKALMLRRMLCKYYKRAEPTRRSKVPKA